jgi:hypothetical protein
MPNLLIKYLLLIGKKNVPLKNIFSQIKQKYFILYRLRFNFFVQEEICYFLKSRISFQLN